MSPLFFFIFLTLFRLSLSNIAYHIDCGASNNIVDHFGTTWLSDRFFTGGATSVVSEPLNFSPTEKTLRFFPPTLSGPKNCYVIPTAINGGRYLFRTFTVYDNYDGKNQPPSFEVSVEGTVVFSYRSPWPESVSSQGSYSDLIADVSDGDANVCFYSIATDPPIVGTLEVIEIDPASYNSSKVANNTILVNYGRMSCGHDQWGPGLSNDTDIGWRSWQSDAHFRSKNTKVKVISTPRPIDGANQKPNYFPMKLYQSAVVTVDASGVLEYELNVDAKLDYLLWFHFAEIDNQVTKAGQRVFQLLVNGVNVNEFDIFKSVGGFKAFDWHYVVKNLSSTSLTVKLIPNGGLPILCGLESYAIVPNDLSTLPDQVVAMRALKDSLRVPDRMGWNGDPCAPTTWNAWEGVTCRTNKDGNALVISQIDLGSQGLKGFISDRISLLTNLAVLNLSSNSLTGSLPEGLGQQSLVKLDLSQNEFTGPIPDSLASSKKLRLVLLNDNQLEGQVPDQIYSVGVHGGAIDLSANKGLCGVPSLPECPFLWRNGRLSSGGKIAIGISCAVVVSLLLLVIYICIRRRRNDYDFGLPHELMSMAAKRNRYHRQKSLMVLEMESQHAKGLIPSMKPPQ